MLHVDELRLHVPCLDNGEFDNQCDGAIEEIGILALGCRRFVECHIEVGTQVGEARGTHYCLHQLGRTSTVLTQLEQQVRRHDCAVVVVGACLAQLIYHSLRRLRVFLAIFHIH